MADFLEDCGARRHAAPLTMKSLLDLRIGYVPNSLGLDRPGDRRRFCYYARKRNIPFEIAQPSEEYDVLILSQAADISVWSRYPAGRTKIIFDFIDSYLSLPRQDPKNLLRGIAKFAMRQNRKLLLNYSKGLEDMCRRADATICSTQEQRQAILPFCSNTHVILDFHGTAISAWKDDYSSSEIVHFVWEGLPGNLWHLREITEALKAFRKTRPFMIHAITDLRYGRYLNGKFLMRNTVNDARKISPYLFLYAWNERTFSAIVRSCDVALIPIPVQDPLSAGKPENKLLLFWRMGMPVLTSATPAHVRAMKQSGVNMACATQHDWIAALEHLAAHEQARENAGQRGKAFAEAYHNEERMLSLWDDAFRSILPVQNVEVPQAASLCGSLL